MARDFSVAVALGAGKMVTSILFSTSTRLVLRQRKRVERLVDHPRSSTPTMWKARTGRTSTCAHGNRKLRAQGTLSRFVYGFAHGRPVVTIVRP